jgi:hypothetical protein
VAHFFDIPRSSALTTEEEEGRGTNKEARWIRDATWVGMLPLRVFLLRDLSDVQGKIK